MNEIDLTLNAGELFVSFTAEEDKYIEDYLERKPMKDIENFETERVFTELLPSMIEIDIFNLGLAVKYDISIMCWPMFIIDETDAFYYKFHLTFEAASIFTLENSMAKSFMLRAANDNITLIDLLDTFVTTYNDQDLTELFGLLLRVLNTIPEPIMIELPDEEE